MLLSIKTTKDGTTTIYNSELDENYHSTFGALQESLHIYINAGFRNLSMEQHRILEIGFGTGLNAILTAQIASEVKKAVCYHSIEKFPLDSTIYSHLNFGKDYTEDLVKIHQIPWEKTVQFNPYFLLKKLEGDLRLYHFTEKYDLVYYDAFAPDKQPDLWTYTVLEKVATAMNPQGILVTYSTKGTVKQILRKLHFSVKRLPGPPGKRDMLFAQKTIFD